MLEVSLRCNELERCFVPLLRTRSAGRAHARAGENRRPPETPHDALASSAEGSAAETPEICVFLSWIGQFLLLVQLLGTRYKL